MKPCIEKMPFILKLSDPRADLETAGGKGMSLAKMLNAGLPVPDGFHVTTAAYGRFVTENELQPRILAALQGADPANPAGLEVVSHTIQDLFLQGRIPPEIEAVITAAYTALQGSPSAAPVEVPVAVRSSATAEDLPGASFAGQQETYLNIRGAPAVVEAVRRCWASLWTARAIAYRMQNKIDPDSVALAVVVQELVSADVAGILFTANPVNGRRGELVINAAWGLGEAVVSGAVTPDTLTLQKQTGKIIHHEIADKQVMTVRTADGTQEAPVPAQQRKQPALTGAQAAELAQLGVKIEQFYGMPMDVEWALSGGRFAIVQARPITALPPEWKSPIPGAIYARGSLAEHIPGPVTPLFATLGLELANEATLDLWRRMFGQEGLALIADSGFYLPINSYVYGGMRMGGKDLWTVLKISFSQIKPFMGGSLPRWHEARRKLAAVVETWQAKPVDTLAAAELYEGVRAVFGAACRYFTDIQTTLPAASMSEMAFTRLYNTLLRRKGGPDASRFLLGFENSSLRSEKSLFILAAWLKTDPTLANTILQTPTADLLEKLKAPGVPQRQPDAAWQEFSARFQRHLASFGSTAYEFDFANPTPLEAPGPLLDALKGFLNGSAQDPNARQREAIEQREQSTSAVLSRTGWPVRGWFQKVLHWAQETAPMREDAIFDMGMGHPLVRRMLGELGKRCAAGGAIDLPDDIYWLEKSELEELIQALDEGRTLPRMCEPIPARKAQWQASLKINAPVMVPERSGWMKFIHGGEAMRRDGKIILKGVGTSGGTITAPACVLYGPEDFGSMKPGCILVAVTTTPAWTPLFAMAAAVVTDIGGPLSHSSIVAREYGIPAVMATRSATRAIRTGQSITVDGSAGTVTVLSDNGHE